RGPSSFTYCFGRSSPSIRCTRDRKRTPSPPASTTAHGPRGFAIGLRVDPALAPALRFPGQLADETLGHDRGVFEPIRTAARGELLPPPDDVHRGNRGQGDERHQRREEERQHEPGDGLAALFPGDPGGHG